MDLHTLADLLLHEVRDLHDCETQVLAGWDRLVRRARSADLRQVLLDIATAAEGNRARLTAVCEQLGASAEGKACKAIAALMDGNRGLVAQDAADDVMDAALVGAARRLVHYRWAGYAGLADLSAALGRTRDGHHAAADAEAAFDRRLAQLARPASRTEHAVSDRQVS